MKHFNVHMPVWKQGDDFASHLEENQHPSKAFISLAEQYEFAAEQCKKLAEAIQSMDCTADGNTHCIFLNVSNKNAKKLIKMIDDLPISEDDYED